MQAHTETVVIWAIDAYAEEKGVREAAVAALRAFGRGVSLGVIPVTVIDPGYLGWPRDFAPDWSETFSRMTRERLEAELAGVDLSGLRAPGIVVSERHSRRMAALRLVEFAREAGASAILVNTHARGLLDRVMLGSFAESLLSVSTVPVLSVNPGARIPDSIDRIFVPTDFGPAAKHAFRSAIELARPRGAALTLYHRIPNPIGAVAAAAVSMTGAGWPMYDQILRIDESERREAGEAWVREAEAAGLRAETVLEKSAAGLGDAIIAAAREYGASLIVDCASAEHSRGGLYGSVVRQILRGAPCPVWTGCLSRGD